MRLVAATQRCIEPDAHGEVREGLDRRWGRFLNACGLALLPLPNHPATAVEIVQRARPVGILLTGGDDLVEYGGGCPERQATECALVERADFDAMPMIGVCRGMQLLLHLSGVVLERVEGHTGVEHQLDRTHRVVNCFHRLGALETGNDWTVTATAGGVVEAVEYRWLPRTGIMWHPEREPVPAESDVALFLQRYGVPT